MPWDASDATRHTKAARTSKQKRQWRDIADQALANGASEGSAIRQANAVVKRGQRGRRRSKRSKSRR